MSLRPSLPATAGPGACGPETEPTVFMMNAGSSIAVGGADGHSLDDLRARGAWIEEHLRVSLDIYLPFLPAVQSAEEPAMIDYGVDLVQGRLLSPVVSQPFGGEPASVRCMPKAGSHLVGN